MESTTPAARLAKWLLAGPRGRRFLLEYVLASELADHPVRTEDTFGYAAFDASYRLESNTNGISVRFGSGASKADLPNVTAAEVAQRLNTLKLFAPTPQLLRQALTSAVGNARYWQEPDGQDLLAATPEMQFALQRVAHHVTASPLTTWWATPADISGQYSVQWDEALPPAVPDEVRSVLRAARDRELTDEQTARRERDPDPTANWSGDWWSHPPQAVPSSTRVLWDGAPAGLWFVEDGLGWEAADSIRLIVPQNVSVFEIADAGAWAELCARFPLEVTAQKRHDWYRTTGRTGRWVVPDWVQVAAHYDAVHLQVGAYLASAGVAIPVDDRAGTASVIAGWAPDETYWFSSNIAYDHEYTRWMLVDAGTDMEWKPDPTWSPRQH